MEVWWCVVLGDTIFSWFSRDGSCRFKWGRMFWNTDSINRDRELVKMCDFNWYRAIC